MSKCSELSNTGYVDLKSKVPTDHRTDKEDNPPLTPEQHAFRIRQLILSRLRVEFPMHDVSDLGMVVQRMWEDIETDTEAK